MSWAPRGSIWLGREGQSGCLASPVSVSAEEEGRRRGEAGSGGAPVNTRFRVANTQPREAHGRGCPKSQCLRKVVPQANGRRWGPMGRPAIKSTCHRGGGRGQTLKRSVRPTLKETLETSLWGDCSEVLFSSI